MSTQRIRGSERYVLSTLRCRDVERVRGIFVAHGWWLNYRKWGLDRWIGCFIYSVFETWESAKSKFVRKPKEVGAAMEYVIHRMTSFDYPDHSFSGSNHVRRHLVYGCLCKIPRFIKTSQGSLNDGHFNGRRIRKHNCNDTRMLIQCRVL